MPPKKSDSGNQLQSVPTKSNITSTNVSSPSDDGMGAAAAGGAAAAANGTPSSGAGGGDKGKERERESVGVEDNSLPRSIIMRLAKGVLPPNTQIQKDAVTALTRSATVFANYLASQAHECTQKNGKKTIVAKDVLEAIDMLEFGHFRPRLEKECDSRFFPFFLPPSSLLSLLFLFRLILTIVYYPFHLPFTMPFLSYLILISTVHKK